MGSRSSIEVVGLWIVVDQKTVIPTITQQSPNQTTGLERISDTLQQTMKGFVTCFDTIGLDNQALSGFLPNETSLLHHLQSINLTGNGIHGSIPSSLGTITSLVILDLSYNSFNGSIPESLGQLTSLRTLNLNSNSLSGRVPAALGGRLLHGASFNFTDNAGLCGIPGLPTCGPHLSAGAKVGIVLGSCVSLLLILTFLMCWWKRRQNIIRAQRIAARDAPYAKARTHFSRDVQMTRHHGHEHTRTAVENGPSLLS